MTTNPSLLQKLILNISYSKYFQLTDAGFVKFQCADNWRHCIIFTGHLSFVFSSF